MAATKLEVLSFKTRLQRRSNGYPTYSGSSNSMALLRILPNVTGSRLLKMAAAKPEVLISQLPDQNSDAVPTANPPFCGSSNSMALLRILPDVTGSRFFKMAAVKPEILISQLLDKIATPLQRLTSIFRVQEVTTGSVCNSAMDFLDT